jgi:glycine/D-amino acid oxidase-like deaminating enzyme
MNGARTPVRGSERADVVVLGAGLTGCLAAWELARRGRRPLVLEAATVGSGASALDLGHVPTGPRLLYVEAMRRWGRDAAREAWQVQRENHDRLRELLATLGDDCGYQAVGGFLVAEDRAEAEALEESEDALREDGFSGEFLDHYMLESRFGVRGFAGAYWCAEDAELDPQHLVATLAGAAEREGAIIRERSAVVALESTPSGVAAATEGGRVEASAAFVALEAATPGLVPFLKGRVTPLPAQWLDARIDGAVALPSPARTCGGEVAWRATTDAVRVVRYGGLVTGRPVDERLDDFVVQHFAMAASPLARNESALALELGGLSGPPRPPSGGRGTAVAGKSGDGFPFVGPVPGLNGVVACGYGTFGLGWAVLAARWAVDALVSGRDATPARFKASRGAAS